MNLSEEERKEAERLFHLRKRIYDHRNIKDWPEGDGLKDFDMEIDGVEIRTKGLSDQDLFTLIVISQDIQDYGTNHRKFEPTGWKSAYISKLAKQEKAIRCDTLWNTDTGMLSGRGYIIAGIIRNEMNRMYDEYVWNDLPLPQYSRYEILLLVDIPDVYSGVVRPLSLNESPGRILIRRPSIQFKDLPNWEKDERGIEKESVLIELECVKQWRVS